MSTLDRIVALRFSKGFETFVIAIITISALLAGAKTIDSLAPYRVYFVWTDLLITILFCTALLIRFTGYKFSFIQFFRDPWNVFDTLVVAISLIPVSDSDLVVVTRLLRLFRVLRMISILPDLRYLISAFIASLSRLFNIGLLLFIIFYMYGVIGSTMFGEINPFLWGDIGSSMLTLFQVMTFEDWSDVMYEVQAVYWWAWIFFISFIFFAAFAFLNMLIGVMVSVMDETKDAIDAENRKSEPVPTSESLRGESLDVKVDVLIDQVAKLQEVVQHNLMDKDNFQEAKTQREMLLAGLEVISSKVESIGRDEKEDPQR